MGVSMSIFTVSYFYLTVKFFIFFHTTIYKFLYLLKNFCIFKSISHLTLTLKFIFNNLTSIYINYGEPCSCFLYDAELYSDFYMVCDIVYACIVIERIISLYSCSSLSFPYILMSLTIEPRISSSPPDEHFQHWNTCF